MTEWNTTLPTSLVVGWTRDDKVTDEQIDALIIQLEGSIGLEIFVWQKEFHATVRNWLATL